MRDTRRRHRMTWPMHDAGSTTPDPGPEEARGQEPPWPEEPHRQEPPWPQDPWPQEPRQELGPDEPGSGDAEPPRRGRHAAPDPLPPIEGPMPGGGPSPAETTLPLALTWPAPPRPARPHRSPSPGPPGAPGSPGAPPGWRRVPRTTGHPPPGPAQPRPRQPTFTPTPAGPPGPPPPGP